VLKIYLNIDFHLGLFISCLFSGALSTLDSAIHALATVTWEEIKEVPIKKTYKLSFGMKQVMF
jgi:hypothetical protein